MKVLITEPYSLKSKAMLQAAGLKYSENLADLHSAEILLIRSRTLIDTDLLKQAPQLKLVVSATSGFDHIDWRACQSRGIVVAQTPNANAQSTAELAMTLMLGTERHLLSLSKNVRAGSWRENLKRPHGLEGKNLGIIGLGRVGRKVARMASAFGMHLLAHDPYIDENDFAEFGCEQMGLIEVLTASDIVTLHVPLTKETKFLLNNPTFGEMQSHSYLINTCRGAVVNENDLLLALDTGSIAGAAMDVIEREPPPQGHRVLNHPKLLLTPHVGAFTETAWEKASMEAMEKVVRFGRGEHVGDTLPLTTPWFDLT